MTRNSFEGGLAKQLKKAKVGFKYEVGRLPYTIEGIYIPDFSLDGGVIIEGKGKFDYETKRKMAAVKRCNPEADIRFVFTGKAHWKSRQADIRWCEKHGYPFAFETIPTDWMK